MRFLANENIPGAAVAALEVSLLIIIRPRRATLCPNTALFLSNVARETRILLTFDKDFGELARASPLPAGCGVVLLRMPMPKPGDVARSLADVIAAREDWADHFSGVEPGRIRMRRLG